MKRRTSQVEGRNWSACLRVAATVVGIGTFICITMLETRPPENSVFAEELRAEAHAGHLERIDELLKKGVPIDQADEYGVSALIEASRAGMDDCVERLLQSGANVNACAGVYGTALIQATMNRHETTAAILLKHGASANLRSPGTNSALWWAIDFQETGIAHLLARHGGRSIHV